MYPRSNLQDTNLRLVRGQFQFVIVVLLVLWAAVCDSIWQVKAYGYHPISGALAAVLLNNPLLCILVFDAIKKMSRPFRVGLPLVYTVMVSAWYVRFSYLPREEPVFLVSDADPAHSNATATSTGGGPKARRKVLVQNA